VDDSNYPNLKILPTIFKLCQFFYKNRKYILLDFFFCNNFSKQDYKIK